MKDELFKMNNYSFILHPSSLPFQSLGDCLFGLYAYDCVYELAVFEDEKRRDAAYLKARGGLRVLVNVQFGDDVSPARFSRQLV
jgi:hypothetical protein